MVLFRSIYVSASFLHLIKDTDSMQEYSSMHISHVHLAAQGGGGV